MIWYIPLGAVALYGSLACATVKPVPVVTPVPTAATTAAKPTPQPLPTKPDLSAICKQLNEMGVQTYPSLNPG
jgi:hypothetical protein